MKLKHLFMPLAGLHLFSAEFARFKTSLTFKEDQMTRIKRVFARGGLAGIVAMSMVDVAVSKTVSNVATGRADAVDATLEVCTAAPFFHDMPSMSEPFTIGGTTSSRVIVLFNGAFGVFTEGSALFVRLMIDGVPQSGPGDVIVDHHPNPETTEQGTHGFNFISDPLAPGTHTAKIQWRDIGAGPGCVFDRSLIVLHR